MSSYSEYKGHRIHYIDKGKGRVIVFLHGFLEACQVWNDFTDELSQEYRVIAIDLPGHGKSDVFGQIHPMTLMAECVHAVLQNLHIEKCMMVGHSMGGYVTLAFAENYPSMLSCICLFHSHAMDDSEAAKANRDRTVIVVRKDQAGFVSSFIPDLFAQGNVDKFAPQIALLIEQALAMKVEGIVAALMGMKERENKLHVLSGAKFPVLFIAGKEDKRIPAEEIFKQAFLPGHAEIMLLGNTGHMGHIEETQKTLYRIRTFAAQL